MRQKRAELSAQAKFLAMEQDAAWLSAKDVPELVVGMTVRYTGKDGDKTGSYSGVDKKGAPIFSAGEVAQHKSE